MHSSLPLSVLSSAESLSANESRSDTMSSSEWCRSLSSIDLSSINTYRERVESFIKSNNQTEDFLFENDYHAKAWGKKHFGASVGVIATYLFDHDTDEPIVRLVKIHEENILQSSSPSRSGPFASANGSDLAVTTAPMIRIDACTVLENIVLQSMHSQCNIYGKGLYHYLEADVTIMACALLINVLMVSDVNHGKSTANRGDVYKQGLMEAINTAKVEVVGISKVLLQVAVKTSREMNIFNTALVQHGIAPVCEYEPTLAADDDEEDLTSAPMNAKTPVPLFQRSNAIDHGAASRESLASTKSKATTDIDAEKESLTPKQQRDSQPNLVTQAKTNTNDTSFGMDDVSMDAEDTDAEESSVQPNNKKMKLDNSTATSHVGDGDVDMLEVDEPNPIEQQPIEQQPSFEQQPVEPIVQQPIMQPVEPIVQQPIMQPVEPIVQQPIMQPVQPIVQQPIMQPVEPIVQHIVQQPQPPVVEQQHIVQQPQPPVVEQQHIVQQPIMQPVQEHQPNEPQPPVFEQQPIMQQPQPPVVDVSHLKSVQGKTFRTVKAYYQYQTGKAQKTFKLIGTTEQCLWTKRMQAQFRALHGLGD